MKAPRGATSARHPIIISANILLGDGHPVDNVLAWPREGESINSTEAAEATAAAAMVAVGALAVGALAVAAFNCDATRPD